MRTRILLSAVTLSVFGISGAIVACSSDDTSNPLPLADSGADVTIVDSSKPDTNVADAAPIDAADAADAADTNVPDTSPTSINGCNAADFADADYTATDASRVITFPFDNPFAAPDGAPYTDGAINNYDPKCMTITLGETVTWVGNFDTHPMGSNDSKPNNPIPQSSGVVEAGLLDASLAVTFAEAGAFGYQCFAHGSMVGAINVKP